MFLQSAFAVLVLGAAKTFIPRCRFLQHPVLAGVFEAGKSLRRRWIRDHCHRASVSPESVAVLPCNQQRAETSPRDRTRHERKCGWAAASIKAILTNEKYRGVWRFNERRWIKMPGTNKRVPQRKDPSEVITYHRPELVLIDEETWAYVAARLKDS